jgi:hypothetical protein
MKNFAALFNSQVAYTDKEDVHHYGPLYDLWLQDRAVTAILELGVTGIWCSNRIGGGSLLAFAERFAEALVIGIDNRVDEIHAEVKASKRITLISGDIYDETTRDKIPQVQFDLIVDDALHDIGSQKKAFEIYSPLLSPGGLYVIEDVWEQDLVGLSEFLAPRNHEFRIMIGDTRHLYSGCFGSGNVIPNMLIGLQRYDRQEI